MAKRWTSEDDKYLKENWQKKTIKELEEYLKRTDKAIYSRGRKRNLGAKKGGNNNKSWSNTERKKLLDEYEWKGAKLLSKELGRTEGAIRAQHNILAPGVKQPKKLLTQCPNCKNKRINKVVTYVGRAKEAYYCMNCLLEFTESGKLIPPLLFNEIV